MDFQQVEKGFKQLKAQYEAGEVTETELKARLKDLMVQDTDGNWWMIGYETEQWYRNEGAGWVLADPPGSLPKKPMSIPRWITVLWIALSWAVIEPIGWKIFGAIFGVFGEGSGFVIVRTLFGATGGFLTSIALQSEGVPITRKEILWITLGWAVAPASAELINGLTYWLAQGHLFDPIAGAIGGLITSIILWKKRVRSNWRETLWITLGWALSWGIGRQVEVTFGPSIAGAISGAMGGFVTVWQLRKG